MGGGCQFYDQEVTCLAPDWGLDVGKLFILCPCRQAIYLATGQWVVILCHWESN